MTTQRPDVVDAIGHLLRADPARTLAVAHSLRAPHRCIESTVVGSSMGHALPAGSRIRIALIHRDRYERGELVAYLAGGQLIVHRVVHRGRCGAARGWLLARGDATQVPDPPIAHEHVLGPLTGVWHIGEWVASDGPMRQSWRARTLCASATAVALGALYVSPRAAARLLLALHRGVAWLRSGAGGDPRREPNSSAHRP